MLLCSHELKFSVRVGWRWDDVERGILVLSLEEVEVDKRMSAQGDNNK